MFAVNFTRGSIDMNLITVIHNASIIIAVLVVLILAVLLFCRFCSIFCTTRRNGRNCRRCNGCPNGGWPIKTTIGLLIVSFIALCFMHGYIHPLIPQDQLVHSIDSKEYDELKQVNEEAAMAENTSEELDFGSMSKLITDGADHIAFHDQDGNIYQLKSITHTVDDNDGLIIHVEKVIHRK